MKNDALSLMLTGKTWPEARDILQKRYERVLKRTEQVTSDDVFEVFMNAFAHVFDPHSSYFSPRNSEEYRIQMSLSYEGIGASLQLVDDYVTMLNVIPGGPAAVDGSLNANDRIIAVGEGKDGKFTDVIGWRLDDVVQLIRGKAGTTVRLQVLPAGAAPGSPEKELALTRNKVTLEAQAAQKEVRKIKRGDQEVAVGVINVPSFYQDFEAKIVRRQGLPQHHARRAQAHRRAAKTEHIDGLVMDLRGNGGGHLTEATALSGLFIPGGPVVQLRETGGRVEVLDDPEPSIAWDGPLIVLVDRFSASASEIFAAPSRTTTAASSSASRPSARARCRTCIRSIAMRSARIRASASSPSLSASTTASLARARSIAACSPTSRCRRRSARRKSARARAKAPCPGIASARSSSAARRSSARPSRRSSTRTRSASPPIRTSACCSAISTRSRRCARRRSCR